MSVKYPTYVNLTSSSEEQPNERTPSPPPRKKSLSPPQAPLKSISSQSTHYTSSSSPSESPTSTHVAPPPKLHFVILIKQEPQELPPLQMSSNNPYVLTMDNWPQGPSNPSPPTRVSRPPPEFPNPPPEFEPLPSTQPLKNASIWQETRELDNNIKINKALEFSDDYDQEDGELPDLPTFSATDEFASNSEQVEENIDIAEEKEGVPMKDVEMDENHDIDHLVISLQGKRNFEFISTDSFYVVKWLLKYNKLRRNCNGYDVINIATTYRIFKKRTKTMAKRTKPSTGMKRAWKTKAEGDNEQGKCFSSTRLSILLEVLPNTSNILLVYAGNPTSFDWMMGRVHNPTAQRLKL
ncbi:hypothetical protein Tco_1237874 [Tanacetum coccineum]